MPSQARDIRYVDIGGIGDAEKGHQGGVAALAFNRTGEQLASAGLDGKMCIWRVNDGRLLHIFVATSSVLSIAWVEENVVLCGTADGAITTISVQAVSHQIEPGRHNNLMSISSISCMLEPFRRLTVLK